MTYAKQTWSDAPAVTSPLSAARLNHMEDGIEAADAAADAAVPATRKVAGKALSADVTLAKADVGLGNVDNTSDADKPISTAVAAALAGMSGGSGLVSVDGGTASSVYGGTTSIDGGHA